MPVRDRSGTIRRAVDSVLAQTHGNWELIVVDDGSTDGTGELLQGLAARDDRIRPILLSQVGVSASRNEGLRRARGEVLAFLDSDNTWRPGFLEYSLRGMRMKDAEAVYSGVVLHRDDGVMFRGMDGTREDLLYAGNFIDLNAFVARRGLIDSSGGFDESVKRWVDYDLFLRLSRTALPVYLPFLGVDYDDRSGGDRITSTEPSSWEDVVLGNHLIDWSDLDAGLTARIPGLVSIVVPTFTDWRMTAEAVTAVLDDSGRHPIEVVVIDNASRRHVSGILRALFAGVPNVRILRVARNLNFALSNNYGLSVTHGEYVVTLNNDTQVTAGWLDALVEPLERNRSILGTQPLLLYPDGTIQTVGTVFLGEGTLPRHFLTGHRPEDVSGLSDTGLDFAAVTAAALCMRTADLIALRGFDPIFTNGMEDVDLCLRARELREGAFRVVPDSIVVHHEGMTPGRARFVTRNRELFVERWAGRYPPDDSWRYEELGLSVEVDQ